MEGGPEFIMSRGTFAIALLLCYLAVYVTPVVAEIQLNHIMVGGNPPHDDWGSSGSKISRVGRNHFRIDLGDQPGIPHQAAFANFRIRRSAKGQPLRMDVHPKPAHNGSYREYSYSWSSDRVNWNPVEWQGSSLIFPEFPEDRVWIAHQIPLSYNQLVEMTKTWKQSSFCTVHAIGTSYEGRSLYRIVVTDAHSPHLAKDRWVHYFANQHGLEHLAQWRIIGMLNWALSDEAIDFRTRSICHFVVMMSPDSPSQGWMRANAEGQDMNRSYLSKGPDPKRQTTEPYLYQRDFEGLMKSESPVTDIWSCHTWGGKIDILTNKGPEIETQIGSFKEFDKILDLLDPSGLVNPILGQEGGAVTKWSRGPHLQYGITAFLCEGGGVQRSKQEALESGKIIIKALSEYYPAIRNR
jgi:hypothetical protein